MLWAECCLDRLDTDTLSQGYTNLQSLVKWAECFGESHFVYIMHIDEPIHMREVICCVRLTQHARHSTIPITLMLQCVKDAHNAM